MIDIGGVNEVLFFVNDLKKAREWYSTLLGIEPIFENEGYCAFQAGKTRIGIHPTDDKTAPGIAGQVAYWEVRSLEKIMSYFLENGCSLFRGPIVGVDGVKVCQLKDPFGNAWGLVEKR